MKRHLTIGLALLTLTQLFSARAAEANFKLPPHQSFRLTNGLTLLLMEKHALPLISMAFGIRAGSTADPAGKEGLAALTAEMLRRGTAHRTADDIDSELDFIGATLTFSADYDATLGSAEFLKKDQAAALDLLADILREPGFPVAEVTKRLQQDIDGLKQEKDEPGSVIGKYYNAFQYGAHPYGRPVEGDEKSLSGLGRDDLVKFHRDHYGPQNLVIAAAGDFKTDEMRRELASRFETWAATSLARQAALPQPAPVSGRKLLLVDKPDATQTYFHIGNLGITATNQDRVAVALVNTLFGGRFTSLLNDALRVNSGYTYGARSAFELRRAPGPFVISSYTANATTVPALDLALDVLRQLHTRGLTDEQLSSAKAYVQGQFPRKIETTDQLAATLVHLDLYGLDTREIDEYFTRVSQVTRQDADRIIRDYFPLENLVFVLIGKAAEIKPAVTKYAPEMEVRDISQQGYR